MFRTISALVLGLSVCLLAVSSSAFAMDEAYFTVKSSEVKDVTAKYAPFMNLYSQPGLSQDCETSNKPLKAVFAGSLEDVLKDGDINPLDAVEAIVDQIINIGKKVWTVVEAGKPVVNLKLDTANALPRGISCWADLAGWTAPTTKVYQIDYKNLYGAKVVSFAYRVSFTANGNVNGVGKYITNASFQPAALSVAWGFEFDAEATIPSVLNQGTKEAPVAGMQMNMAWKVTSPLKHIISTDSYFVGGDNKIQRLE